MGERNSGARISRDATDPAALADADQARRVAYAASRRLATYLLCAMGGLLALANCLPIWGLIPEGLWMRLLRAGSRAGLVGGIADWFAITALFRRPLGLPIPHTAILPRQKRRLGEALGRFVATSFFTQEDIAAALSRVDTGALLATALRRECDKGSLPRMIRQSIPAMLVHVDDGRATASIERALPVLLQGEKTSALVVRSLRALVESDLHQEVVSFLLLRVKEGMRSREPVLRRFIEDRVREQGGRLVGWAIGASIASRVLSALNAELERIDPGDSSVREGFTNWARQEIDRMENDPERRGEIVQAITSLCAHDSLRAWLHEIWARFQTMISEDSAREDGWSAAVIKTALMHLADECESNASMRAALDRALLRSASSMLPDVRTRLTGYIAAIVDRWDNDDLVGRLELRVGKDLQYIRISGTLVGFLVGTVLEGLSELFFPPSLDDAMALTHLVQNLD